GQTARGRESGARERAHPGSWHATRPVSEGRERPEPALATAKRAPRSEASGLLSEGARGRLPSSARPAFPRPRQAVRTGWPRSARPAPCVSPPRTGRGTHRLDPLEKRDGGAQPLELAPALRAIGQVGVHQGALPGREGLIEELGQPLAGLVAGHGRNRSIFSLRSRRAR